MAFTQTDIDRLKEAIATGAMRVRYADGREITYRSLSEMTQVLQMLQGEVAPDAGSCRTSVASF